MKNAFQVGAGRSGWLLLALVLVLPACGQKPGADTAAGTPPTPALSETGRNVRLPAVAGLFYPKAPQELSRAVDGYLAAAPVRSLPAVAALICPHAGYEYSGPTAAHAYRQIAGGRYETVVILAASHYAAFRGAAVPATDAYETPLGRVPVSAKARELAKRPPFVLEPRCRVQRPQWAGIASKPAPAPGEDSSETWEHSIEVQLPFLQRVLKEFSILPVTFGDADPATVARALAPLVDEKTLVIASTDLSHYRPYDTACATDRETVKAICELDFGRLEDEEARERACGRMPVLTLLHLAKLRSWRPQLLDYRNSGDTAGDKRGVVGYAAVAFTGAAASPTPKRAENRGPAGASGSGQFGPAERAWLLAVARQTLRRVTDGGGLPEVKIETVPAGCREAKGCFVTLTKQGELRGCIGNIMPAGPLYRSVIENARNAALEDPRFRPVTADEARGLRIEVSVLSVPEPLDFTSPEDLLAKLEPHRDGVVLQIGERRSTFLPQVWEQLPDKVEFLNRLAVKGGSSSAAWRGQDVRVARYRVEAFTEPP